MKPAALRFIECWLAAWVQLWESWLDQLALRLAQDDELARENPND